MIHHSGRYGHPPFRDFIYEAWIFPEKPLVFFETSGYNQSVFDVIFAKGVFAVISLLLLKQIAQLFLSIFLGWVLVKTRILKPEDSRVFSLLSLYGVMPCIIISSFQLDYSPEIVHGLLLALGSALGVHIICFLLTALLKRPLRLNTIEQATSIYSNAGNLIIPIVIALFGKEWLIYTSAFTIGQIPLLWSHLRFLVSGEKSFSLKKLLCNVNIISILIGLVLFLCRVSLPSVLIGAMDSIGGTVGPLSMVIAGMLIAGMDPWRLLTPGVWKATALRLVGYPLVVLAILKLGGFASLVPNGETILLISFLAACAPSAATITQMAQVYGRDAEYSSAIYAVTTLLCIITMPLMVTLYQL